MKEAHAIIRYIDMQMKPLRADKTLTGVVESPIEYEVPQITGYRYTISMLSKSEDERPTFIEPKAKLTYLADQTPIIELRYQKLPDAEPTRADAKQWVAQANHKFLVKSQQGNIPVFDDNNQALEHKFLQPNTFGTYVHQKEVSGQMLYQIAPHQWVRAKDVVLVQGNRKTTKPELWQAAPVELDVVVQIPENMAVMLWHIDASKLSQRRLVDQQIDNGTHLHIDAKIMIAGELFYHIVDGDWIKAKYVRASKK